MEQSHAALRLPAVLPAVHPRQRGRGRYRAVPDRYLHDPASPLSTAEWDELEIPVGLGVLPAQSSATAWPAFYPSPAGATECLLDLDAWAGWPPRTRCCRGRARRGGLLIRRDR